MTYLFFLLFMLTPHFWLNSITLIGPIIMFVTSTQSEVIIDNYHRGYASENILSKCDFFMNACRFRNQHNLAKYNRYFNTKKTFWNRNSMLLLDINSPRNRHYPGARLITSYYPAEYSNACLFVSYRYNGPGVRRFFIIQQNNDNKCIYSDDRSQLSLSNSLENVWNYIELELNLRDGNPRFFLETQFNHNNKAGYFAIGNFTYGYGNCRNKTENHCYDQLINKYINVAPTAN